MEDNLKLTEQGEAILYQAWRVPLTRWGGWMLWSPDLPEDQILSLRGAFNTEAAKTAAALMLCHRGFVDLSDWQDRSKGTFRIRYKRGEQVE